MKKLALFGLDNGYVLNSAYAYIYYGTKEKPEDQNGNSVNTSFYPHHFELKAHLEKEVVPVINRIITLHGYNVVDMDIPNQGHHPALVICRNDKKQIDLSHLNKILDNAVKTININNEFKEQKTKSVDKLQNLNSNQVQQSNYQLRSTKRFN